MGVGYTSLVLSPDTGFSPDTKSAFKPICIANKLFLFHQFWASAAMVIKSNRVSKLTIYSIYDFDVVTG